MKVVMIMIDWEKRKEENKIRRENEYNKDTYKEQRIKERNCKKCRYLSPRIALQAFTNSNCMLCGKIIVNPTSDIDTVCMSCSEEKELCVHCGEKLD